MNLQTAIEKYQMPQIARQLLHGYPSLNIAGPTGAGKGTMVQHLTQTGSYAPVVSDTTRLPRPFGNGYEVNGVHYWFVNTETALQKLQNEAFIEAKLVHGDTVYGTTIDSYKRVVESGRIPILEIDVQGMEELMKVVPGFEAILLLPPSFEVWEQRINDRGGMTIQEKIRRFETALVEYSKPLDNTYFFPVINTEVIDTAKIIQSGAYREESYRQKALELAINLRNATQLFIDSHKVPGTH